MAPHLVRTQSAHKHTHTHTRARARAHACTHTRTHARTANTCITGDGFVQWEENDILVCRREEMSFQFWLKRRQWRRMPDRESKRIPDHRFDVLKGSLPQGPPAPPRSTKIRVFETERREPDGEYRWSNSERYAEAVPEPMWKQMRAILYWIRLLIGKVKEWCGQI